MNARMDCPHCHESVAASAFAAHTRTCPYADAIYPLARTLLDADDNPGYITSEQTYERKRAQQSSRLPSATHLRSVFEGWAGVAEFFALALTPATIKHLADRAAARGEPKPEKPPPEPDTPRIEPETPERRPVDAPWALNGYEEHEVRAYDPVSHTWYLIRAISLR